MIRLLAFVLALVLNAPLAACHRGAGGGSPEVGRDRITAEQIAATGATDAWECVERLRPNWLRSRGPRSLHDPTTGFADVFVDGHHHGKIDVLHQVVASDVHEIRFLAPGPAAALHGMGYPRGIIEVIRKGR